MHAYWGRQARRLREERRLHEELNNPWAIRERYAAGTGVRSNEGSAKEGSVFGGSIVRGIMYGLYVLNPSGSFSFGSSRVETNEKEVKARREAKAEASAVGGVTNGDGHGRAATTDTSRRRNQHRRQSGASAGRRCCVVVGFASSSRTSSRPRTLRSERRGTRRGFPTRGRRNRRSRATARPTMIDRS